MLEKRYRLKLATWTVVRESGQPSPHRLNDPEVVAALARDLINANDDDREHFWVLLLNTQNHLILTHHVSMGSLSASIVHPREVFRAAILGGAAHLILLHNHPSGDPTPSKEDVHLTRQLAEGARVLGLRIHDHLIVGNGSGDWVSLATRGVL
jgi:DNA repair protein RadC